LIRLEYLGFSCVCVIGALSAVGQHLRVRDAIVLFLIHMFSIIWGFVHNDYCDVEYDKFASSIKERPLANGTVSYNFALWTIIGSIIIAFGLTTIFYMRTLPLTIYILSVPLAALYNKFGKSIRGSDILFASSASLLCLLGAVAVSEETYSIFDIKYLTWIIVAIQFVDHLFFNISGSLKDVVADRKAGAITTPIALGVIVKRDNTILIPASFKFLMLSLKVITIALVFLPFFYSNFPFHPGQILILSMISILALHSTWKTVAIKLFDRNDLSYLIIRQENYCKALVPLMLVNYTGIYWLFFFLIPPVWFIIFNKYISGSAFQPPKTY